MLLYRLGPEGFFAVRRRSETPDGTVRMLHGDPYVDEPETWELGRRFDLATSPLLAPAVPGKIVGIGRNYRAHAEELGNEVPPEPLLFLKSPSSVVGPRAPIVLPPVSQRVEYEGEIAVVLRRTLRHASRAEAEKAVLGICCACDVTARDLQRRDATFARALPSGGTRRRRSCSSTEKKCSAIDWAPGIGRRSSVSTPSSAPRVKA